MSTGTAIIVVGGIGVAAFLYFRSQQQQQAAIQVAAAQQTAAAGGGGGGGSGGGVGGLVKRGIAQWMQDPLGIQNTKAALGAGVGVVKAGVKEVISLPSDIIGGIRSIF